MSFMNLTSEYMKAYSVETTIGTEIVPHDLVGDDPNELAFMDYCEGEPLSWESVTGWFAWYSAPGYLDRTDYLGPFATEKEALEECESLYGDNDS